MHLQGLLTKLVGLVEELTRLVKLVADEFERDHAG